MVHKHNKWSLISIGICSPDTTVLPLKPYTDLAPKKKKKRKQKNKSLATQFGETKRLINLEQSKLATL